MIMSSFVGKIFDQSPMDNARLGSGNGQVINPSLGLDTVTISRSHYEQLLHISRQFECLKSSLLKGGIPQERIDVLLSGPQSSFAADPIFTHDKPRENDIHRNNLRYSAERAYVGERSFASWDTIRAEYRKELKASPNDGSIDGDTEYFYSDGKDDDPQITGSEKTPVTQLEQRTLEIRGLPERATHRDVTEVVRGGALLEVYLRFYDRSARVSFVEPSAAQDFMNHAKRNDIYVQGKRAEVSWSDRQFYLRRYIKQNIDHGATRNLVIRRVHPNVTASLIRDHLDHIHNLIVVDIKFGQGNVVICTNSVHNAMFARSCMLSRATYRGMRIEFFPDECTRTLPKVPAKIETRALAKAANPLPNRFQMLSLDESEDSEDSDDNENGVSMPTNYQSIGRADINWKHHGIAV